MPILTKFRPFATIMTLAALTLCPSLTGCSGGGAAPAVDSDKAREALVTVLESWKRGEAVDTLKTASPVIVVQDFDWMAGSKLVDYEVTSKGKYDDANLRIPVTITLQPAKGKAKQKKVSYVVGTSPTITVFRDFQ